MTRTLVEREVGLPWGFEVHELSEGLCAIVYDDTGTRARTDHLSAGAAAFIVRAVNSHADLVEALKRIELVEDDFSDRGHGSAKALMKQIATAALAKVKS